MSAMRMVLSLTDRQHARIKSHLFPGDGREAVVFALCGRRRGEGEHGLLVKDVVEIPYEDCPVRTPEQVVWNTSQMPNLIVQAEKSGMALLKIHSHPTGYPAFSKVDDRSDCEYFGILDNWFEDGSIHASAVMLPDGEMFGRSMGQNGQFASIGLIKLVGDDIVFWPAKKKSRVVPDHGTRIAQAFGDRTYQLLSRLKIAVIGCSGTGSLVAEQLGRNCVGELVLVDPDRVERKNLNRIPQATMRDAKRGEFKVKVMERAISRMGFGTNVTAFSVDLHNQSAIRAVAGCDVVFGCMDSIDGRHLLNRLATFYLLPYFDVGVKLVADDAGGIQQICGSVHYLKPGGSSLLSRRVYTIDQVRAAALYRSDPEAYEDHLQAGYIEGVNEEKPAVISVNMLYAALAVNELLSRIHPFRLDPNAEYNQHTLSISHGIYEHAEHDMPCTLLTKHVGRGDVIPPLDMPALSDYREGFVA